MGTTGILVVEDDELTREVLVYTLTDAGYTVYQAPNGRSALEQMRTHQGGLVALLDLMMPDVNGLDVLQTVAAESPLATCHTYILMTAVGTALPLQVGDLLKQLSIPCLPKPYELDDLMTAVEQAAARLAKHPG
jgi:CheY-like chemotaxis protein